jgi:hypothetical protein
MSHSFVPRAHASLPFDSASRESEHEVIVPYEPLAGPVTAVRNTVVQSSIAQLKSLGHYQRYVRLIAPDVLEQLLGAVGPSWIPIALVEAHYEACDSMMLDDDELAALGRGVGSRLSGTSLVALAKTAREPDFDCWSLVGPLYRMWARLFVGGSVQVVKLGPTHKLIGQRGYSLNRFRYYRHAQLSVFLAVHEAVGIQLTALKVAHYSPSRDEASFRLSWA